MVTELRNRMFDQGLKPSVRFEVPVISVGNLSVGGTGKTPMIEYLVRLLQPHHKVASLSRGYGRKSNGFRIADSEDNAQTLGDEPFQLYKKYGQNITVSVGEERALAIPLILQEHENTQVILLDDAFQHRQVVPRFSILLTDYHKPFYDDYMLPAGRLREGRRSAKRADVIVVTKCPSGISVNEMTAITKSVIRYAEIPIFFSTIRYGEATPFRKSVHKPIKKIALITAIANADPLIDYVNYNYTMAKHFAYRDHHYYSPEEVKAWADFATRNPDTVFLTTEKDKVKLEAPGLLEELSTLFYYLPIEMEFIKGGRDFDEMILNVVKSA